MFKRVVLVTVAVLVGGVLVLVLRRPDLSPPSSRLDGSRSEIIERGQYLTKVGNCLSCHTTADSPPFSGGVAFKTPVGTIYSTNITSHPTAGIGSWSEAEFRRAMHHGIRKDGARLFPAFPYTSFTKVSDADIAAMYEYLRTVPASANRIPENSFAFTQRWAMAVWNWLFFKAGRYEADPENADDWNRGAYLTEGLAHCGACHSPRNVLMAEIPQRAFEGGVVWDHGTSGSARSWFAVNLTPAQSGLGAWRRSDIKKYLLKGYSDKAAVFGPMNDVYLNSTRFLTNDDADAIALYLTSLPPRGEYTGSPPTAASAKGGETLFDEHCEECHGSSGRGSFFGGPPLVGSAIAQSIDPSSLINVVLHGPQGPENLEPGSWDDMPAYADKLTDDEISSLANYIRSAWKNRAPEVSAIDVRQQR
jgi:mono/diheme cytochrome c family protein